MRVNAESAIRGLRLPAAVCTPTSVQAPVVFHSITAIFSAASSMFYLWIRVSRTVQYSVAQYFISGLRLYLACLTRLAWYSGVRTDCLSRVRLAALSGRASCLRYYLLRLC